ncbi:MAG: HutD family protein [Burkholderiaceae bacterium]|nr:HutD family protein [Burkholderiaceae bacterium]
MKAVAYSSLVAAPWKNGGGVTRELACYPAGAGFDDFLWRVSIADVHQSGPFSRFPGIDRVILLLDGGGMVLRDEAGEHALTEALAPHAFRGELHIDAELVGPSRDFNLMLRRGRVEGAVSVLLDSATLEAGQAARLLFCASGQWQIDGQCELQQGDHVLIESGLANGIAMLEAGALLCVDIKLI